MLLTGALTILVLSPPPPVRAAAASALFLEAFVTALASCGAYVSILLGSFAAN